MINDSDTQIQTGGAEHPMAFLLNEDFQLGIPSVGDIVTGVVVEHRPSIVLVDINAKSEGLIYGRELDSMDSDTRELLAVGNEVNVYVVEQDDNNGNIVLSYRKAAEETDWITAQEMMDSQDLHKSKVVGFNRGGILVRLGSLRGFVPASQLSMRGRRVDGDSGSEERFRGLLGDEIACKVVEVDRRRNRLILSEKAAMREARAAQKEKLLAKLEEGTNIEGVVVNIADFGAFVDIGGIEGLVHVSELSWKRTIKPEDIVSVGQEVNVHILRIEHERQRIALSMKRLEADPWTFIHESYVVGQLVETRITKLTSYGAFASLEDEYGLEGLIHISELADDHVKHPRDVVNRGDAVTARIIRVDPEQRQIGLSIKQVASSDYMDADLAHAEFARYDSEE